MLSELSHRFALHGMRILLFSLPRVADIAPSSKARPRASARPPERSGRPCACARIFFVNIVLKSLIVWVMLLALPFQGFASATMLLCAPLPVVAAEHAGAGHHGARHEQSAAQAGHDHQAMMAATGAMSDDVASTEHHADGKCGSCSACGIGAALAPSHSFGLTVQVPHSELIPFDFGHVPRVDLALPERPPQSLFA
jgi:hypothetical protein